MAQAALPAFPRRTAYRLAGRLPQAGVCLRAADMQDIAFLQALYASTRAEELAATPWPAAMRQAFVDQQFALQHRHWLASYPHAEYLVVERDGRAIGRCYVDFGDATAGAADEQPMGSLPSADDALLVDIALMPEARGGGVGSVLLAHLLRCTDARRQGVALHVLHANPGAQRLYRRFGFVVDGEDGLRQRMRRPASAPELS